MDYHIRNLPHLSLLLRVQLRTIHSIITFFKCTAEGNVRCALGGDGVSLIL
jgi:hypothetical protein